MRKVQFYGAVSIDGYLATTDDRLDWLFKTGGADQAPTAEFMQAVDTAIMGRRTYEYTMEQTTDQLINPYNPLTKNIVMTSDPQPSTAHTTFTNADITNVVKQLLTEPGQNIWIVGGSGVLMPLLTADLVDELFIQVAPVLLGDGIPLFTKVDYTHRFELVETNHYGQLTELHFQR
ncbi:dihydrofolate reductase [Lactobacillus pentosus] [Lactiplantibacillus mudanjiangensis]|uniref:dihydrofolate reductase family protein n=1 Tax=Lactiplantibacillus mudanjiangensis TaxID=1296538 RepID=UPI001015BCAE|nr:dihydrofolate reductase family protein [Lactiplantibacillus mudanjiangensis]VDG33423.1 dihydrofolate reductase [Lactobacillus pentosus] [Lactiplantibacillus mudanjiangensis]